MQEKKELNMSDFRTESESQKSFRINGWCQKEYSKNSLEVKSNIQKIEIKTVSEFLSEISKFKTDFDNPIFYRGHSNANYIPVPGVLRGDLSIEDKLYNEFSKRFSSEISVLPSTLDKMILMQHYELKTRLLDVTENPLVALYFACKDSVKFPPKISNDDKYGCILLFQEEKSDEIKYPNSLTAKVIANTGLVEKEFSYKKLQQRFYEDYSAEWLRDAIYFKDIVRRSIIIRSSRENPRIINQSGAFILVNANELYEIKDENGNSAKTSANEFMKWMLTDGKDSTFFDVYDNKKNTWHLKFPSFEEWKKYDFMLKKVVPYSPQNKYKEFQEDPFDLNRLYFKDKKNGKQIVFFIPPNSKKQILDELETLNIDECTMFPEKDTVAHYLNDNVGKFRLVNSQ